MQALCGLLALILSCIIFYIVCNVFFSPRWEKNIYAYAFYIVIYGSICMFGENNLIPRLMEMLLPIVFFKGNIVIREIVFWGANLILGLVTMLLNGFFCAIFNVDSSAIIQDEVTARMLFVLSLVICYYLISFLKIKVVNRFSQVRTPSLFHFSVVLILLVAIICFLVQIYKYELSQEVLSGIENATCAIFILVIIIDMISFEILKKSIFQTREYMEEKARVEVYEMQRKYEKLTTEQLRKLSALRHDFKNHLYIILERVRREEKDEAIDYIEKICQCTEEAESIVMAENEILATILTIKNAVCKSKNIMFEYEINCGKISIEDIDLNIVVGNLMDNAIEAAERCDVENRKINFKVKDVKQFLAIECYNTCKEDLKIQENKLETTKKDNENHGFGIGNIKETVARYGGRLEFKCEKGIFSVKIMMENT